MRKQSQGGKKKKKIANVFFGKENVKQSQGQKEAAGFAKLTSMGFSQRGHWSRGLESEGKLGMVCQSVITAFERYGGREIRRSGLTLAM